MAFKQSMLSDIYDYNQKQVARVYGVDPSAVGSSTFQQTQVQRQTQFNSSIRDNMKIMNILYSSNSHVKYSVYGYGDSGKTDIKYYYGFRTSYEMISDITRNLRIQWETERDSQMINARVTTRI